ncbi:MAG TPA: peptide chain release factor-like protein [Pirellulaceae bacterium]|jgi:hypothetical protein|nr:peptide chain release factor-like protein [Pirellulaceae bacterium]
MSSESSHPATWPVERLLAECDVRRQRRSGPGGQHRNKVETAVVVTHRPTGLKGDASETRSQERNRQNAVRRLRTELAVHVRTAPGDEVSELWRKRCTGGKIDVSTEHDDFPALLAEALDVLEACDDRLPDAAEFLGCSASQIVKFLKSASEAFALLNARRAAKGLHPLG